MAEITSALVKELRERTGVGMMDCKAALSETKGDLEAAVDLLRKKGLAKAASRPKAWSGSWSKAARVFWSRSIPKPISSRAMIIFKGW